MRAGFDLLHTGDSDNFYSLVAMTNKTQLLIALIILCVVDAVVPFFPVLGLVLIYVVLAKPPWFLESVRQVYEST